MKPLQLFRQVLIRWQLIQIETLSILLLYWWQTKLDWIRLYIPGGQKKVIALFNQQ